MEFIKKRPLGGVFFIKEHKFGSMSVKTMITQLRVPQPVHQNAFSEIQDI
jgi:hypothetical protein